MVNRAANTLIPVCPLIPHHRGVYKYCWIKNTAFSTVTKGGNLCTEPAIPFLTLHWKTYSILSRDHWWNSFKKLWPWGFNHVWMWTFWIPAVHFDNGSTNKSGLFISQILTVTPDSSVLIFQFLLINIKIKIFTFWGLDGVRRCCCRHRISVSNGF